MTENNDYLELPWSVEDTIEHLKTIKEHLQKTVLLKNLHGKGKKDAEEVAFDFDRAIQALEEIQEYKEIGTVDDVAHYRDYYEGDVEYCGEYGTHDCQLRGRLEKYEAIGTVEECRMAVERIKPKKPIQTEMEGYRYTDTYRCPACGGNFSGTGIADFCYHCGQALDWLESEE